MKLNKREFIILSVTLLAVIYLVISHFFSKPMTMTQVPEADSATGFVTVVAQSMAENSITKTELLILKKAQAPWEKQPFLMGSEPISLAAHQSELVETPRENTFIFSGDIEFAGKRLAIINGTEYATGEQVEGSQYWVRDIFPDQVLLSDKQDRTQIVPMVDAENIGSVGGKE